MNPISRTLQAALCSLGMIVALAGGVHAAQDEGADDAPAPPEISEQGAEQGADDADGESREDRQAREDEQAPPPPRVHRREEFGQTITEYERGGRVFLMTVKPRIGPTQYWDDPDGDGQFQRRNSDTIDENHNLPKWRLGEW